MEELLLSKIGLDKTLSFGGCSLEHQCAVGREHIPAAPSPQPHTLLCNKVTALC